MRSRRCCQSAMGAKDRQSQEGGEGGLRLCMYLANLGIRASQTHRLGTFRLARWEVESVTRELGKYHQIYSKYRVNKCNSAV